jgi:hypothetical protein
MLFAAVLLQASIAAPAFAPPLGAPLRIVTERIETSPAERRYRLERLVRFSKEGTGYRAEAVLLTNASAAPEALGNLVERGLSALAGRTIVLHLDDRGQVTTVDEMAALWERVCQRIAEAAATRPGLPSVSAAAKLVAPLRALPPERQRALLATLVTAAIMTDPRESPGSFTPVRLPGASPFGTPVTLEGTRRTATADNGLIEASTTASATVDLRAPARCRSIGSVCSIRGPGCSTPPSTPFATSAEQALRRARRCSSRASASRKRTLPSGRISSWYYNTRQQTRRFA